MTFHLKNQMKSRKFSLLTIVVFNKGSTEIKGIKHDATLAAVGSWFHKEKLTIYTKTKRMVFRNGRNLNQHKSTIDRAEIEQTSSFRYLVLILDNQLKFKDHINYVKERLSNSRLLYTEYALLLREHSF